MHHIRQDRFFNLLPGVTDEQFKNSQFLKLYDQTERCPSCSSVINSLLTLQVISNRSHPILRSIKNEPDAYDTIKKILANLIPFIRRATNQINHNSTTEDCILYRGMHLNDQQRQFFTIGKFFRFPGFTTTTENIEVARSFGNTLFEIHILAPCHQVINVTNFSYYEEEKEWLFSPYSRFQVTGKKDEFIILQSVDNLLDIDGNSSDNNEDKYSSDTDETDFVDSEISETREITSQNDDEDNTDSNDDEDDLINDTTSQSSDQSESNDDTQNSSDANSVKSSDDSETDYSSDEDREF
ncbi:unnamed protein product [Rotaria sordida]|uniref:NAD(P)(+)--arginine ADP-ribosyltransferase n=1 Tax=Rotaria sordida TaxID=392033 RepID=A0A814SP63_9BILA|nr:unnamed protein product [Rotaria sordida]CAF1168463.1 unnamed protein product [Rotaria sordida]CAF3752277.1 unnamed protein product [Rotaria sordida]CAF3850076.1 unnamed protein product [Rotaria sordida]